MAATTALLHYAGDVRPVKLKRMAQEAPAAHPERVEARSEVGEATERRDDDHGDPVEQRSSERENRRLQCSK